MKRVALLGFLFVVAACVPAPRPAPTPQVIIITVVVPPTAQPVTPTVVPTATQIPKPTVAPCTNRTDIGTLDKDKKQVCILSTYIPCIRWDEVTANMKDKVACVRGTIQYIDETYEKKAWLVHWDFTGNKTGFFALSNYGGWHPETGKDMKPGDCVVMTGKVRVLASGRPYIFWGENSIYKAAVAKANTEYYEHPDLWVIEGDPSFCE